MTNNEYLPGYMLNEAVNPQAWTLINRLKPVYREAFKGEPWFEVTKCADPRVTSPNCVAGLSSLVPGELCAACGLCPTEPAYTDAELNEKFADIGKKQSALYVEESGGGNILMASIAYTATASQVAMEKYSDVPDMQEWLSQKEEPFIWLDEVFADRSLRASGNLNNFSQMLEGLASILGGRNRVLFRTISPAMVAAARRFGSSAVILEREKQVPDRRDFVTIQFN